MALSFECMQTCASKVLDTADIVRDGDFSPINEVVCKNAPKSVLSLRVEDMCRICAAVVLFTMLCGIAGCSHREQSRKEASLRDSLTMLRSEIGQFTLDHRRPPNSLSELVTSGYLKRIPTDPFTGNNDNWRTQKSSGGEYFEVHSGSDAIGSDGTKYSSW
jgi:general secretion pathway protein G